MFIGRGNASLGVIYILWPSGRVNLPRGSGDSPRARTSESWKTLLFPVVKSKSKIISGTGAAAESTRSGDTRENADDGADDNRITGTCAGFLFFLFFFFSFFPPTRCRNVYGPRTLLYAEKQRATTRALDAVLVRPLPVSAEGVENPLRYLEKLRSAWRHDGRRRRRRHRISAFGLGDDSCGIACTSFCRRFARRAPRGSIYTLRARVCVWASGRFDN